MEGKNKKIAQETPAAASTRRKSATNARSIASMSPSNLPKAPTSFQGWKKPSFMHHAGAAGASGSGTNTSSFQAPDPFSMKGEKNKTISLQEPNPLSMKGEKNKTSFFQAPDPLSMKLVEKNKTSFFRTPDPLSMKGEKNKRIDQNPSPTSNQNQTLKISDGVNSDKTEVGNGAAVRWGRKLDLDMDPKKLRRVISNRLSAQKSRMKKLQYVSEMEKKVEVLESQIAVLAPQVALYRNQKHYLQMEQKGLKQRIAACAARKSLVDAEVEMNKAELNRLRQLQMAQQQQKLQAQASMGGWEHGFTLQMVNPGLSQSGTGHTMYVHPNQAVVGDNTAEIISRLSQTSLNPQQEPPGQIPLPGWEPGLEPLLNMGFNQPGPGLLRNPSLNQSTQLQNGGLNPTLGGLLQNPSLNQSIQLQNGSLNTNLGGLEQLLNMNLGNQNPRNDFI
ncbi:Basic-leucine zipper domain - like 10 [Theobroma cacao]|nr:Basic-leucine zipper domain - like 10 [Theobroma cacao]